MGRIRDPLKFSTTENLRYILLASRCSDRGAVFSHTLTATDNEVVSVGVQSGALEAFVIAHKWYRKSKLLNFVTFTVGTDPPRAAPTPRVRAARDIGA